MRAIVKDDERPHQEAGGRKDQRQRQQIRDAKREVHQGGNARYGTTEVRISRRFA